MPDYDFHQLSPDDLEVLSRDLLQAHWGAHIESFKTGRDSGIDLRFAAGQSSTVVQVKHYLRTGLGGLMRDLKKEAAKVRRLAPSRYVLVTSVPLTPPNKDDIVRLVGTKYLQSGDVIGADDLNNLIGQHPEVEGRHYKLWLASRGVLDRVIHNAAATRSEFKARQVHEQARRYVASDAYPRALEMLRSERVVIIAGPPGVGKTTLADLLLYAHLERGYQAILIQRDVEEGEKLFRPGSRQIFYFDDFMGATFAGDRLRGSSDRALLDFIAMVRARPDARLVLTSREHVLAQALGRSERLRGAGLDDLRVMLHMPSYTKLQRARILYNHIYFSDLPGAYRDRLLDDDFYMRIVNHKNFNPRLIQWLSSYRRLKNVPVGRYRGFVDDLLRDSSEIWRHAYDQEISEAGRTVLLAVRSLGGRCGGEVLESAFEPLHARRAERYGFPTRPDDFRTGAREVVNSFIKPWGQTGFEVIDPSVLDLLNAVARGAPNNIVDMFVGAASFEQIEQVWSLAKVVQGRQDRPIMRPLRHHAELIALSITRLAAKRRRVEMDNGSIAYFGPTFERRLAIIVEMAHRLGEPAIRALIAPAHERLVLEWDSERPQISDTVGLIRVIDAARTLPADDVKPMRNAILEGALNAARNSCRSDELRELIGVAGLKGAEQGAASMHEILSLYQQKYFAEELDKCRLGEHYSELIENLELLRDELGIDVSEMIQRAEDACEHHASQYTDHMQDDWDDRWRVEQDEDRNISEMFDSLRSDRSQGG